VVPKQIEVKFAEKSAPVLLFTLVFALAKSGTLSPAVT
jgi:hypothetical protein